MLNKEKNKTTYSLGQKKQILGFRVQRFDMSRIVTHKILIMFYHE